MTASAIGVSFRRMLTKPRAFRVSESDKNRSIKTYSYRESCSEVTPVAQSLLSLFVFLGALGGLGGSIFDLAWSDPANAMSGPRWSVSGKSVLRKNRFGVVHPGQWCTSSFFFSVWLYHVMTIIVLSWRPCFTMKL